MNKKMGKRVIVTLMAVMLLMATSVTAFAASNKGPNVSGTLTKSSSTTVKATTTARSDVNANANTYAYAKAKYITASGSTMWSSANENSKAGYVIVTRTISGTVIGGESGHGVRKSEIEFNLSL